MNDDKAHVLVVDDDEDIRFSVTMLLEDACYHVTQAASGASALERLRASPEPLVVLLDLLMPGMSGADLLNIILADPHLPTRHAYVIVTANNRALLEASAPARRALAAPLISKPFDVDELVAIVAEAASRLPHT